MTEKTQQHTDETPADKAARLQRERVEREASERQDQERRAREANKPNGQPDAQS